MGKKENGSTAMSLSPAGTRHAMKGQREQNGLHQEPLRPGLRELLVSIVICPFWWVLWVISSALCDPCFSGGLCLCGSQVLCMDLSEVQILRQENSGMSGGAGGLCQGVCSQHGLADFFIS